MTHRRSHPFLRGLLLGAMLGLPLGVVLLHLLPVAGAAIPPLLPTDRLHGMGDWISANLGLSPIPFGITLGLFVYSLRRLSHLLETGGSTEAVAQLEHLIDVWISLFFGIGVIWTAIGMRSALLYALGDPGSATQAGAYVVLQRLVEGGILTALSTTILGGIGGYLMRVVKTLVLGARLTRHYEAQERHQASRTEDLLRDIRESLRRSAPEPAETRADRHLP